MFLQACCIASIVYQVSSAGISVSVDDVVNMWKHTSMSEIVCDFDGVTIFWGVDEAGVTSSEIEHEIEYAGSFRMNEELGMRLQDGQEIMNILDGRGLSYGTAEDSKADGMYAVYVTAEASAKIQSAALSDAFRTWVMPNSSIVSEILKSHLGDTLKTREDERFGTVAELDTVAGGRRVIIVFSKEHNWRPVSIRVDTLEGKPVSRKAFRYVQQDGVLSLVGFEHAFYRIPSERPWRVDKVEVKSVIASCSYSDLVVDVPNNSVVMDEVGMRKYIVREDGSNRQILEGELANAKDWSSVQATESGELLTKSRWPVVLVGIVGVCCALCVLGVLNGFIRVKR